MYQICTFSAGLILFMKKKKKTHIDLFWHTQPSAERIKSIQWRVCTDSHVCTQTHTHTQIATHGHCFLAQCFAPSLPLCSTNALLQHSSATLLTQSQNIQYNTRSISAASVIGHNWVFKLRQRRGCRDGNVDLVLSVSWSLRPSIWSKLKYCNNYWIPEVESEAFCATKTVRGGNNQ